MFHRAASRCCFRLITEKPNDGDGREGAWTAADASCLYLHSCLLAPALYFLLDEKDRFTALQ